MRNVKKEGEPSDEVCDKCGAPMVFRWGRNGRFLACSKYPECKNTQNVNGNGGANGQADRSPWTSPVKSAASPWSSRKAVSGSSSAARDTRNARARRPSRPVSPAPKRAAREASRQKRTKKGKSFYGCSKYPACKYAIWDRPIAEECPQCGSKFLVEKYNRKTGRMKACPKEGCTFKESLS